MPFIKLFGGLRRIARFADIRTNGNTVREAIDALGAYNPVLWDAILDGERLRSHVRVMVNGHDIELGSGLDTPVSTDDQIAIFPPMAGGASGIGESV